MIIICSAKDRFNGRAREGEPPYAYSKNLADTWAIFPSPGASPLFLFFRVYLQALAIILCSVCTAYILLATQKRYKNLSWNQSRTRPPGAKSFKNTLRILEE